MTWASAQRPRSAGRFPTPTFDQLAKAGLRYNTFHTTALCSPTRAALITGRNHHTNATGVITEMGTGFPGYNTLMPKSSGTVGEILKQNGYNTSWFGKNHNVPDWQSSQAGPFDLWPTGLGFEYFYGFIGGDTDQWHSAIFDGTKPIERRGATTRIDHLDARPGRPCRSRGFASSTRSRRTDRSSPTTRRA